MLNCTYEQVVNSIEKNNLNCLFLTNVLGYSSDLPRIKEYCKKNIILLEDNCESLGTILWDNSLTGSHGLMSSHSFFIAHIHMSTIEVV